jgi:hypothetical protein
MNSVKKEIKSPKLIMSLVTKSQAEGMLITPMWRRNLISFLFLRQQVYEQLTVV